MIDTPRKLSDTARAVLTFAATRTDHLVRPPQLPAAAARQVVRSLLNNGLVEEVAAPIDDPTYDWRGADDGTQLMLRATDAGLAAIGEAAQAQAPLLPVQDIEAFTEAVIGFLSEQGCTVAVTTEDEAQTMIRDGLANGRGAAQVAGDIVAWLAESEEDADDAGEDRADANMPTAPDTAHRAAADADATPGTEATPAAAVAAQRPNLRQVAQAVLDAWNDEGNRATDMIAALEGPMAHLHAALAERTQQTTPAATRKPREGTKQAQVLAMLSRSEGATVAQIAEAMGWAPHTVRGFFAGLKKKGITVETLERVRVVGPNKAGAKGSFTIYHIPAGPEA